MIRLLIVLGVLALLTLAACWSPAVPTPREEPVPAALEAERLRALEPPAAAEVRDLRAQELEAARAAATARAAGDAGQAASHQRLAEELARLRAAAEDRERQQREAIGRLAAEADQRAQAERAELDRRAAAAERAADARRAEQQRQRDRRWAGWGLALSAVAAIALRVLGLPALIALGGPAAIGAGCLTLAAWSSVPWLATVLGIVLAAGLAVALAVVVRHLIAEWTDYAARLGQANAGDRQAADAASLARQPAWLRWLVTHLLAHQRRVQANRQARLPGSAA